MNVDNTTRLDEIWDEWTRANELIDSRADEGYLLYDDSDTITAVRGVLRDVCSECAVDACNDQDSEVSEVIGYEGHESYPAPTCDMCGEDFLGMKDGVLVLFEPGYVMKRWG